MSPMSEITVTAIGGGRYRVDMSEGRTGTSHVVNADAEVLRELGMAEADPEQVVRESFVFLLEREPASSILREFSLDVIPRYFPEYRSELPRRVGTPGETKP